MAVLPTGTVTFLFTDIEGSTRLWERDASAMKSALARHDEIVRSVIEERDGHVFKPLGDTFCASFSSAPEALGAAISAQRALHDEEWEEGATIRVRMALHTGAVDEQGGDYFWVNNPINQRMSNARKVPSEHQLRPPAEEFPTSPCPCR
jgi:class 3 adenylate cyclase